MNHSKKRLGFCLDLADLIRHRRRWFGLGQVRGFNPEAPRSPRFFGAHSHFSSHFSWVLEFWCPCFFPFFLASWRMALNSVMRWTVFDPVNNAQNILVNILPLDEEAGGCQRIIWTCWSDWAAADFWVWFPSCLLVILLKASGKGSRPGWDEFW